MPTIELTPKLRTEYRQLFDSCEIRPEHANEVQAVITQIFGKQLRYGFLGTELEIPWFVIAAIHSIESSLNFNAHLHNGDPLTARTVHVPSGRSPTGIPPFTWEESVIDALNFNRLSDWRDWSIPGILYRLEAYNGFGYRAHHPEVLSPYLWSYSNHYLSGKYVADGTFSASAISKQCGVAVLLRRMSEVEIIRFNTSGM